MALPANGMLKMSQIWAEYAAGTIQNFNLRKNGSTDSDWCPKNSTLGRGHNNCAITHYYGGTSTSCIVGSGGAVSTSGSWKIHKITNTNASTQFMVTSIASGGMDNNLYRMITGAGAGGGGGGNSHQSGGASRCGGGGSGGHTQLNTYAAVAGTGNGAICGKGGAGGRKDYRGTNGGTTVVDNSAQFPGGGAGGSYSNGNTETGATGAHGGGGAGKYGASTFIGGFGTSGKKNAGGSGNSGGGGGGGGSDTAGGNGVPSSSDAGRRGGRGGNGLNYTINQTRYGAGGSGAGIGQVQTGGLAGGGNGGKSVSPTPSNGYATDGLQPGAGGGGGGSMNNGVTAETGGSGYPGAMYIAYRTC